MLIVLYFVRFVNRTVIVRIHALFGTARLYTGGRMCYN